VPTGPPGRLRVGYWLLAIGDDSIELEVPWGAVGGNPYADLLRAVREVVQGAPRSSCSWLLEPGEYRWELFCEVDDLEIRIVDSGGTYDKLLFDGRCRLREFVRAVASAMVIDANDDLGFLRGWLSRPTKRTNEETHDPGR
jgi:hypothetical protein